MSKLREAAQAVVKTYLAEPDEDGGYSVLTMREIDALRDALAEDRLNEMQRLTGSEYLAPQYELWGRVTGGHGSRWPVEQFDGRIWPDGTALYVKIAKGEG